MSLSIKGGHAKEARAARSSGSTVSCRRSLVSASPAAESDAMALRSRFHQQQVHEKLAAANVATSYRASGGRQPRQMQREQRFGSRRAAHHVRLLSIISALIVIALLSRECTARAFLGLGANGNSQQDLTSSGLNGVDNYGDAVADKNQAAPNVSPMVNVASAGDLEYMLNLGCRNLVESLLYPQLAPPNSQRAAMEFMELVDNERIKRLSPKHTPRFGR